MTSDDMILLQQWNAPLRTFYCISVVLIILKVAADLLAHLWIGLITGLVWGVGGGLLGQIPPRSSEVMRADA